LKIQEKRNAEQILLWQTLMECEAMMLGLIEMKSKAQRARRVSAENSWVFGKRSGFNTPKTGFPIQSPRFPPRSLRLCVSMKTILMRRAGLNDTAIRKKP